MTSRAEPGRTGLHDSRRRSPWSTSIGRALLPAVVALVLAACAGDRVALATQNELGCLVANTTGLLVPDPSAGTAIVSEDMAETTAQVVWPAGFTGRRNGDRVEVLDRGGHVVARTGERYELLGGYNDDNQWVACVDGVYPPLWPSPRP